jgi:hypothetical protein
VFIVGRGYYGINSQYPNSLQFSCLLQLCNNRILYNPYCMAYYTSTTYASISKTFANIIIGACYSVSFWYVVREVSAPSSFKVILGDKFDNIVYSTTPTSTTWVQVNTSYTTASSTSITLRFEMNGYQIQGLAISAVYLEKSACMFLHAYISTYVIYISYHHHHFSSYGTHHDYCSSNFLHNPH